MALSGAICPNGSLRWARLITDPRGANGSLSGANSRGVAFSAPLMAPAGAIMAANRAVIACIWTPSCFKWS